MPESREENHISLEAADPAPTSADLSDLLQRAAGGERDASAQLALRYGAALRRRIRGKLSPRLRRLFDSEDILATVMRRLDAYVANGHLQVTTEPQFFELLRRISEAAVIDKARLLGRLERVEGRDALLARSLKERLELNQPGDADADETIQSAFEALPDDIDRQILWLWLAGLDHVATANSVGLSAPAVRKRWMRIRVRLRKSLARSAA